MDQRIHGSAPTSEGQLQGTKFICDNKVRPFGFAHIQRAIAQSQSLLYEVERPDVAGLVLAYGQRGPGLTLQVQGVESDQMPLLVD